MLPTDKEECGEHKIETDPKMRLMTPAGGWLIRDHGKNLDLIRFEGLGRINGTGV